MVTVKEYHDHIFSKEFRVAYYCGNLQYKEIHVPVLSDELKVDTPFPLTLHMLQKKSFKHNKDGVTSIYITDILSYFERINGNIDMHKYFYFIYGDHIHTNCAPCFGKARFAHLAYISDVQSATNISIKIPPMNKSIEKIILLKLNSPRHWGPVKMVNTNDIPFLSKKNKLFWRGASTGTRAKHVLTLQHHPNKNIDIKFTKLCDPTIKDTTKYIKADSVHINQILEHKFILSMEGNDVATDLKWLLYSNSVVFMCTPTKCSWAMEELLLPYVHYIPVKGDYSDLEEKYNWALNNQNMCIKISQNATAYIQYFLNEDAEKVVTDNVILHYMKMVNIKLTP